MVLLCAFLYVSCVSAPPSVEMDLPPVVVAESDGVSIPAWPETSAPLYHPVIEVPSGFRQRTVMIVAGHGAPGNHGNKGCNCEQEEDFTLRTAESLSDLLDATGLFRVVRGRVGTQRPSYSARLRHMEQSGVEAMVEIHSDSRADAEGQFRHTKDADGSWCWRADTDPGFSVLLRDRGNAKLVAGRLALARSMAKSLSNAGIPAYDGSNYSGLYEDDVVAGVFRDRRGLKMLTQSKVPSVIIEAHNARDSRETIRWTEERTHDAFQRAVLDALIVYFSE